MRGLKNTLRCVCITLSIGSFLSFETVAVVALGSDSEHSSKISDLKEFYADIVGPVAVGQLDLALRLSRFKSKESSQWEERAKYCGAKHSELSKACCLLLACKNYYNSNDLEQVLVKLKTIETLGSKMNSRNQIYLAAAIMYFTDSLEFYPSLPSKTTLHSRLLFLMKKFADSEFASNPAVEIQRLTVLKLAAVWDHKLSDSKTIEERLAFLKSRSSSNTPSNIVANRDLADQALVEQDYNRALTLAATNQELLESTEGLQSIKLVKEYCIRIAALNNLKQDTLAKIEMAKMNDLANKFVPPSGFATYSDDVKTARKAIQGLKDSGALPDQIEALELIYFKLGLKGQRLASINGLNSSFQDFLRNHHPDQVDEAQDLNSDYLSLCDFTHVTFK